MGSGYAVAILLLLLLSYAPGGLQRWQTLVAFDLLAIVLIGVARLVARSGNDAPVAPAQRPSAWVWAGIASIVLVATLLRLPGLSYSEFQDDEVSVVWRAAEVIQGREDALFVHDKGPAEILMTTGVYSLTDRMSEGSVRLPFAVANLTALLALFWLGWRFFGPVAGWAAAMLLAVDGYFIGFSRIVQYQSIVFLMVVLVAGILYTYVQRPRTSSALAYLAALFFAAGVLAHFEAAIVVVPSAFLLIKALQHRDSTLRAVRHIVFPVLLALAILLLFYVPFSLHPRFERTFSEITGNRIGTGFPYNNLADFFTRTIIYSSTYYFVFVVAAVTVALILVYRRVLPRWLSWLASIGLVLAIAAFFAGPEWLSLNGTDYAWLAFALALAPPLLGRRVSVTERATWIWFAAALILALFFIQKPRTHVYDFFIPMALIVGGVVGLAWNALDHRTGRPVALSVAIPVASVLTLVFAQLRVPDVHLQSGRSAANLGGKPSRRLLDSDARCAPECHLRISVQEWLEGSRRTLCGRRARCALRAQRQTRRLQLVHTLLHGMSSRCEVFRLHSLERADKQGPHRPPAPTHRRGRLHAGPRGNGQRRTAPRDL